MTASQGKVINKHGDQDLDLDSLLTDDAPLIDSGVKPAKKSRTKSNTKQNHSSHSPVTVDVDDLEDRGFKIKLVSQPINLVKFNYRNKRVTSQLVRFISDDLINEMLTRYPGNETEGQSFIIDNINRIPINSIISELRGSNTDKRLSSIQKTRETEKKKYPCHDDLYNVESEGIFVGKGMCFSNVTSANKELNTEIDSFIDAVHRNGKSVEKNGDVVEKPIVYANGSNYVLKSGHQRLCYLIYAFGRRFQYDFVQGDKVDENLHIYLENNAKHDETGYEQILSYYHTIKEQNLFDSAGKPDEEAIKTTLAIGRTKYFRVIHFINNPALIDVVKRHAVAQKFSTIMSKLTVAKKLYEEKTKAYRLDTPFEDFWEQQLTTTPLPKESNISIKFPDNTIILNKLIFSDVRVWSTLNFDNYDLSKKSDIQSLISDLAIEAATLT
jgi:hypothetical protein